MQILLVVQGSTNFIFGCTDICAPEMVLCARSCMQNYVRMQQSLWELMYII